MSDAPKKKTIELGNPRIPEWVTLDDLNDALQPLLDLLGINRWDFYDNPGLIISRRNVGFLLAAGTHGTEVWDGKTHRRNAVRPGDVGAVQVREHDELGLWVSVDVKLGKPVSKDGEK